jgi:O-antigen ligase
VWIAGILSIAGLAEVFIFGETPRTLLYMALGEEQLPVSFHATGFTGVRESATMLGPNGFGALCMIALILWWVYCRNPLPAAMIAVGLVCSLTRAAWVGVALAIPLLAVLMNQKKRFALYAAFAVGLFVMSIPVLGLNDYIFAAKTGQDTSADWHRDTISDGLKFAIGHPFGAGNDKIGTIALKEDRNALVFETTYPELAAQYGIAPAVCLMGFLFSALYLVWKDKSNLGYAVVGVLVAMFVVTIVTLPLEDRRLASWAMFPLGLAVRSATRTGILLTPQTQVEVG